MVAVLVLDLVLVRTSQAKPHDDKGDYRREHRDIDTETDTYTDTDTDTKR